MYYSPPPPPPFFDGCSRAYDYCSEEGYADCCAPGFACMINEKGRHQCLQDPTQPPPQFDPNNPYGPPPPPGGPGGPGGPNGPYGPQQPPATTTTTSTFIST
ncbi:hypothetical protein PIROE2DRAFT_69559 [Piromyces sp. E2]|nr:hypothetical protein PIROE2DRAFT_69559 [Piromyces sp. E2]|eukprot:OUM61894.1 hypothetical protein PIROE2DRAFT_69559 [Piromyces sp. E2]